MLPEAKLDILLAHHASLEAQIVGQLSSEDYVRISRELAELNPLIDAVKAYRAAAQEIAGIEALIADPAIEPEMRGMAEAERETLAARHRSAFGEVFDTDVPVARDGGDILHLDPVCHESL